MPPRTSRRTSAIILTAGVATAVAILVGTACDSTPPPQYPLTGDLGQIVRTPDDPANPNPAVP